MKFYAIAKGYKIGIFTEAWSIVKLYVEGFSGAKYKSFTSYSEAEAWFKLNSETPSLSTTTSPLSSLPLLLPLPLSSPSSSLSMTTPSLSSLSTTTPSLPSLSTAAPPLSSLSLPPPPSYPSLPLSPLPFYSSPFSPLSLLFPLNTIPPPSSNFSLSFSSPLRSLRAALPPFSSSSISPATPPFSSILDENIKDKIIVYTDGSCVDKYAGWGVVITMNNQLVKTHKGAVETYPSTNNQGELTAILSALNIVPESDVIYSDSQYAINSVTKWAFGWRRNKWRKADGKPVKNKELIETILNIYESRNKPIDFRHIAAHAGHEFNELADSLANEGRANYS